MNDTNSPADGELRQEISRAGSVAQLTWPGGLKWSVTIPIDELMQLINRHAYDTAMRIVGDDIPHDQITEYQQWLRQAFAKEFGIFEQ